MTVQNYKRIYKISAILVFAIWVLPIIQANQLKDLEYYPPPSYTMADSLYIITESPRPTSSISGINELITLLVGAVNLIVGVFHLKDRFSTKKRRDSP